MPNCVIKAKNVRSRVFVGSQIDECKDQSGLYYLLGFQKVSRYSFRIIYGYCTKIVPYLPVSSGIKKHGFIQRKLL